MDCEVIVDEVIDQSDLQVSNFLFVSTVSVIQLAYRLI